jgi:hypothetical protein
MQELVKSRPSSVCSSSRDGHAFTIIIQEHYRLVDDMCNIHRKFRILLEYRTCLDNVSSSCTRSIFDL